jgi:hypothetical protein
MGELLAKYDETSPVPSRPSPHANEIERFLTAVERVTELGPGALDQLKITAAPGVIDLNNAPKGPF